MVEFNSDIQHVGMALDYCPSPLVDASDSFSVYLIFHDLYDDLENDTFVWKKKLSAAHSRNFFLFYIFTLYRFFQKRSVYIAGKFTEI